MDPLTAISVASNVVQFIDFGIRLLRGSREIYNTASGSAKELDDLATVVWDLKSLTQGMKTSTTSVAGSSLQTRDDAELLALAREAESSADKLLGLLLKLEPQGTHRWGLFRSVFKYTQKRTELEAEKRRLDMLRAKLELIV